MDIKYYPLLLLSCTLLSSFEPSGCVSYYIQPTSGSNVSCPPKKACHTLDYYAQRPSILSNQLNVSLLFLGGIHQLFHDFKVSNVDDLLLAGLHQPNSSTNPEHFLIECYSSRTISLDRISSLKLVNLTITIDVDSYFLSRVISKMRVHRALLEHTIMDGVDMEVSGELVSVARSLFKNSFITVSTLYHIGSEFPWSSWLIPLVEKELAGQDLKLLFSDSTIKNLFDRTIHMIYMIMSPFEKVQLELNNVTYNGGLQFFPYKNNSINLLITEGSTLTGSHNIDVVEINFDRNGFSSQGHDVLIQLRDTFIEGFRALSMEMRSITAKQVTVSITNSTIITEKHAMDVVMKYPLLILSDKDWTTHFNVSFIDSTVTNSHGVGFWLEIPFFVSVIFNMSVTGCTFRENKWALYVMRAHDKSFTQATVPRTSFLSVMLRRVTFMSNYPSSPVITVTNVNRVVIEDCTFIDNEGTALEAYFSDITLSGNTRFINNTGTKGGAIGLYQSYILLAENSNTSFVDNYAKDVGGAIYVHVLSESRVFQCFYLIDAKPEHEKDTLAAISIWFKGNTARNGGDNIYGGTVQFDCSFFIHSYAFLEGRNDIVDIFHFENPPNSLSLVASLPTRTCLCDNSGKPQCAHIDFIYAELAPRYPGEVFSVPAVVVGNDFGTVPGLVFTEVSPSTSNSSLVLSQRIQELKRHQECSNLTFSLESQLTNTVITLKLSAGKNGISLSKESLLKEINREYKVFSTIRKGLLFHPVYIDMLLEDCPTGFNLTSSPPFICSCHPKLEKNDISVCIVINHTGWVFRSGTIWVSKYFSDEGNNSFLIHKYCPHDYCKPENISIDLSFPDNQCVLNRSGILCGGCQANFSLALGSSRCLQCNNNYLALLLLFVIAGIALVFFVKVLDLTVAKGTLYGIIFYANIVWVNKNIFFQATMSLYPAQRILYIFIAWLNLDLGIETCFIDGLNEYWKTWLQYLFPIYIWSITGAVITASYYSTTASKIFGNNSVPVLATLVFLSYTKLLGVIVGSLGFALIEYPEGTRIVWSLDGNVFYFGTAHTILFLVAITTLILLWLPYTLILLTLQWLRRKSHKKLLRWVNRLKPFFDAYFGQLKPKCHYWVGLLLLIRVILLVLSSAIHAVLPTLNIYCSWISTDGQTSVHWISIQNTTIVNTRKHFHH